MVVVKPAGDAGKLPVLPVGGSVEIDVVLENPSEASLDASIDFTDFSGLLFLLDSTGKRIDSLVVPVVLKPGESAPLRLAVGRWDLGDRAPDLSSLLVRQRRADGSVPILGEFIVQLVGDPAAGVGAPFGVARIVTLPDPPRVEITVPTRVGWRYQVEESPDLRTWAPAPCAVLDTTLNPDGTFNGTGRPVTCAVPCDIDDRERFFRVVELP